MLVLELKPTEIREEDSPPERSASYVHEHLKYFLSLERDMPAVRVLIDAAGIHLLDGHRYLRIARELEKPGVRAVVDKKSDPQVVETLAKERRVVHESEWEGQPSSLEFRWHVFFLEPPLDSFLVERVRALIAECFHESTSRVIETAGGALIRSLDVDPDSGRIAFEAQTPWADEGWISNFLSKWREFSQNRRAIITYQGRRWTRT